MKNAKALFLALSFLAVTVAIEPSLAKSKRYTITARQESLSQQIERGQRTMELTQKESNKLRDRMNSVSNRIEEMKSDNGGKLSYRDQGKIEKSLNRISLDLKEYQLKKRLQP